MSWSTTRDAIEAVLLTVAGISGGDGNVHDHLPRIDRPDEFAAAFKAGTKVNAWLITREGAAQTQTGSALRFVPTHEVRIEGQMGTKDAATTEDVWQTLIDAVLAALAGDLTIFPRQPEDGPIVIRAVPIGHKTVGDVFCHYTEIRFVVQDAATVS